MLVFGALALTTSAFAQPLAQPATGQPKSAAKPTEPAAQRPLDVPIDVGQFEQSRSVSGVRCAIRVHAAGSPANKAAIDKALDQIERVLRDLVFATRTNQIHSINANADRDEVVVDGETGALLQHAIDVCRRTGGAYDPTVATFDYLWNFAHKPFVAPLPAELQTRKAIAGCKHMVIKHNTVVRLLQRGMRVTLRHVAKGYALDRAAHVLRENGLTDFRIQVDRQVYVQGRTGTRHWYAAAPHPRDADHAMGQLYLGSHAAVTRSDGDAYVVKAGRRYHDVLDPRTGLPASGVAQATVIAADPSMAAMLAEAVFVLGPKAGLALLAKERNVDGFVVDTAGRVLTTKGMADLARLPLRVELGEPGGP